MRYNTRKRTMPLNIGTHKRKSRSREPLTLPDEYHEIALVTYLTFLDTKQIYIGPKEVQVGKTLALYYLQHKKLRELPFHLHHTMNLILGNEDMSLLLIKKKNFDTQVAARAKATITLQDEDHTQVHRAAIPNIKDILILCGS